MSLPTMPTQMQIDAAVREVSRVSTSLDILVRVWQYQIMEELLATREVEAEKRQELYLKGKMLSELGLQVANMKTGAEHDKQRRDELSKTN